MWHRTWPEGEPCDTSDLQGSSVVTNAPSLGRRVLRELGRRARPWPTSDGGQCRALAGRRRNTPLQPPRPGRLDLWKRGGELLRGAESDSASLCFRSGLEQDDMRILYKYLTTSLFPRHIEPELAGRDSPIRAEMPGNLQHYGRFLTGPLNLNDPEAKCRFPKIFVNTDDTYEALHLIVYKAMSAAVCFMIDASVQPTLDFCRRLDSIVGPQLTVLASDICEQFNVNKRVSGSEKEPQFKFIYFNHMNLAEKSTIHMRKTPSVSLTSVHPDLMKILGDINSDFTRVDEDEEIIVKAMSDYWVVGKKSDQRELYVILNQKNANLIEVNEEVKKLCATQFSNIFFLD